jgi:hypothetical protein
MAGEIETRKQENGSLLTFQCLIEASRKPTEKEYKAVYPDIFSEKNKKWLNTYELQAKALKNYISTAGKGYSYSRDIGIMPAIHKLTKSYMGVSNQNSWNPFDIVMVKTNKEKEIMSEMEKISKLSIMPSDRLNKLNLYMKDLLTSKTLIPISLKEIKSGVKTANISVSNLDKKSKGVKFKLVPGSLKCDLDIEKPPILDTGEFSFKFSIDDEIVTTQIRSFRYSKSSTGPQTDITPVGRQSGAKLGKVSVEAMNPFLLGLQLTKPPSPVQDTQIAIDGKFTSSQINFWNSFYEDIKDKTIEGQKIDWDDPINLGEKTVNSFSKIIEYSLKNKDKPNVLGKLYSKLVILRYIKMYQQISIKGKFNEWLSVLYYGAKKEFSDMNGPFIKIY